MSSWHSYPSVYALGHRAIAGLLDGPVVVQEKVDGSQFSFGKFEDPQQLGTFLRMRSKGKEFSEGEQESMFNAAVETVKSLGHRLQANWTYRAEYLQKPKHNVLEYSRIPRGNLILFDICIENEDYLSPDVVAMEADALGLDCVETFYRGPGDGITQDRLNHWLTLESGLRGTLVEGVVIKNYSRFGEDKKALMGKYVSEAFKEKHAKDWRASNPTKQDIIESLIESLRTEARWNKAVQHLTEAGAIEGSPRDIGPLLKEVQQDIIKEEADWVREKLYEYAIGQIKRGVVRGLPEWYKQELAKKQFSHTEGT